MMNENLDPIAFTETKLGKRHEYWNDKERVAALAMIAKQAEESNSEPVESIDDTHFRMTWNDFIKFLKKHGFKCGFCQKFQSTSFSKDVEEEEVIFFHEEKGLILYAYSWDEKTVNGARVYGQLILNESQNAAIVQEHDHDFGWIMAENNGNGTKFFVINASDRLLFHLNKMSQFYEFSKIWGEAPSFLWFLNYMDTKQKNYNDEKINKEKIAACTPEVRKIIFG